MSGVSMDDKHWKQTTRADVVPGFYCIEQKKKKSVKPCGRSCASSADALRSNGTNSDQPLVPYSCEHSAPGVRALVPKHEGYNPRAYGLQCTLHRHATLTWPGTAAPVLLSYRSRDVWVSSLNLYQGGGLVYLVCCWGFFIPGFPCIVRKCAGIFLAGAHICMKEIRMELKKKLIICLHSLDQEGYWTSCFLQCVGTNLEIFEMASWAARRRRGLPRRQRAELGSDHRSLGFSTSARSDSIFFSKNSVFPQFF